MKFFSSKNSPTSIDISNESIIRSLLVALTIYIGYRAVTTLADVLTLIAVAMFLAIALNPAVTKITKDFWISSRALATGVAYVFVLAILAIFLALVVPPLVTQTAGFVRGIPKTIASFQSGNSELSSLLKQYKLDGQLRDLGHELSTRTNLLAGPVLNTAGRIGGTIVSIITVLVLTFMFLVEGPAWLNFIWSLQPASEREKRKRVAYKMYKIFTGYVNGQVLISLISAIFAAVALLIGTAVTHSTVNIVALTGIVFLFGLIPLIGNTLGAVVVVISCLFVSSGLAIGVGVIFLVYEQVKNATFQPYIQARSNNLTALIVFIVAILGAGVGGLLGALASIPIAGCLRVLFDEYAVERIQKSHAGK